MEESHGAGELSKQRPGQMSFSDEIAFVRNERLRSIYGEGLKPRGVVFDEVGRAVKGLGHNYKERLKNFGLLQISEEDIAKSISCNGEEKIHAYAIHVLRRLYRLRTYPSDLISKNEARILKQEQKIMVEAENKGLLTDLKGTELVLFFARHFGPPTMSLERLSVDLDLPVEELKTVDEAMIKRTKKKLGASGIDQTSQS